MSSLSNIELPVFADVQDAAARLKGYRAADAVA